jgi:hypothetical protein
MEIPGKVSLYCSLVEAKGTAAQLVAVSPAGYYHLEVTVKGQRRAMLVPIASAAVIFAEPEPEPDPDLLLER